MTQGELKKFVLRGIAHLFGGLCLLISVAGLGATEELPSPADFNQVDYYLLTVGRGPRPEALFGHTILRVVDNQSHWDLSFNWGIFDFADPAFPWKFYRGDLNYALAIAETQPLIDHYRRVEKRSIIQERLVLTVNQKRALYQRLLDNAKPENLFYQYHQFLDNCATRPRDHLNAVLGGVLRQFFTARISTVTRRQYIQDAARPSWWVYLGLDMSSNDFLDATISNWDEMFLPIRLRELLFLVPAIADDGTLSKDRKLLEGAELIVDMPEPRADGNPYFVVTMALGGILVATLLALGRLSSEATAATLLGGASLVYGLWSAIWGTVLTSNWVLSDYVMLKHNAALWLVWPIDWIFVVFGIVLLVKRSRPDRWQRLARGVVFLSSLHLTALAVILVLSQSGLVKQTMQSVLASTGLCGLVYYGTMIRQATRRES
ncbi:MAG: DUF4105 domain-containing protein [Deltaproteobacteria bacterium]|nr:DUF4105 domain-containing protein [Deltaproteobacteria bacterium]